MININKINDKDDRLLISNILDKYYQYINAGLGTSTVFLNEYQLKFVINYLKSYNIEYNIYALNDYCFKKIIYFGEYNKYISAYHIVGDFSHREVLGALFSIYKDPNLIGDIFVDDNHVYFTNLTKYNKLLEQELKSIGSKRVELEKIDNFHINHNLFIELQIIVPSLRIDSVISKLCNLSRTNSSNLIKEKKVLVNYKETISQSLLLKEDDIISIRGYGKYKIGNIILKTRKDNNILKVYKYN